MTNEFEQRIDGKDIFIKHLKSNPETMIEEIVDGDIKIILNWIKSFTGGVTLIVRIFDTKKDKMISEVITNNEEFPEFDDLVRSYVKSEVKITGDNINSDD